MEITKKELEKQTSKNQENDNQTFYIGSKELEKFLLLNFGKTIEVKIID